MLLTTTHCSLLCSFFVVLFPWALSKKVSCGNLENMAGSPALPLLQVLLEQVPAEPQVLWRNQTNAQHFQYMVNLYQQLAEKDGRPKGNRKVGSNIVRLVKASRSSMHFVQGPWHTQVLKFQLQALPEAKYLVRATAVCSRTWSMGSSQFFCKMELLPADHVISKPSFTNQYIYTSHERSSSNETWVELDVTSHVQSLMEGSKKNFLQHLNFRHVCSISGKTGSSFSRQEWKNMASLNIPFLLLFLNDTQKNSSKTNVEHIDLEEPVLKKDTAAGPLHSRRTRQAGNIGLDLPSYRQNTVVKNQCSLRSFRVSFHQLGWDHWIIAPHKYNPKYCKGDCPRILRYGYNSPNHAIVQNFINELVDQNVPRPSCVPYKYSPISVLMIEPNGSILYKEYENMIAESCTCR